MDDDTSSEVIEIGGDSLRWLPRKVRGLTIEAALITLALGLAIGFAGGRVSAPDHRQNPGRHVAPVAGIPPIAFTGNRCSIQVGKDLEVGIEIENSSPLPVEIRRVSSKFQLGGLSEVAGGAGTCGELPDMAAATATLLPGASEWVRLRLHVKVKCPEPYPVEFQLSYTTSGKGATTRINGFPDLGEVAYRNCGHEGRGGSAGAGVPAG